MSFPFPSRFLQLDLLLFLHNVAHILVRAQSLGAFDLIICGATIVQIKSLVYEIRRMDWVNTQKKSMKHIHVKLISNCTSISQMPVMTCVWRREDVTHLKFTWYMFSSSFFAFFFSSWFSLFDCEGKRQVDKAVKWCNLEERQETLKNNHLKKLIAVCGLTVCSNIWCVDTSDKAISWLRHFGNIPLFQHQCYGSDVVDRSVYNVS